MANPTGESTGFATGGGSRGTLACPELFPIVNSISFAGTETVAKKAPRANWESGRCTPSERRKTFSLPFYWWQPA